MGPIKHKALLNVDLGEGFGNLKCGPDEELLPHIDIANVACGFHSGDPLIMMDTVRMCKEYNVKIGAHPGLPDLQGFGRREMKLQPEELTAITVYQVGALKAFLDREELPMNHVKPHGTLYGMMSRDLDVATAVMKGIPKGVPVFGLAGTNMEKAANEVGVEFWAEMYGDVKYTADGMLVIDRIKKYTAVVYNMVREYANLGARPWKLEDVEKHVTQQLTTESVTAVDGSNVHLPVKNFPISICCHSDSPGCVGIIKTTRAVCDKFNKEHGWS